MIAAHQEGERTSVWLYRDPLSSNVQRTCLKDCREQRIASPDQRQAGDVPVGERQLQAAPPRPREQAGELRKLSAFVL